MKYQLINATKKDIPILKEYKYDTIVNNKSLSKTEEKRIIKYINKTTKKYLKDYQLITMSNTIIGSLLIRKYKDSYLLDELYIIKEYRYHKIGSNIIKDITTKYNNIYLYVYKNNQVAINLYLKYCFKIVEETSTRYLMKYER